MLINKKGDITYPPPPMPVLKDTTFSASETQMLKQLLEETKIFHIRKSGNSIFYAVWSVPLEGYYGLFYFYSGYIPSGKYLKHLKGNWYFDH